MGKSKNASDFFLFPLSDTLELKHSLANITGSLSNLDRWTGDRILFVLITFFLHKTVVAWNTLLDPRFGEVDLIWKVLQTFGLEE